MGRKENLVDFYLIPPDFLPRTLEQPTTHQGTCSAPSSRCSSSPLSLSRTFSAIHLMNFHGERKDSEGYLAVNEFAPAGELGCASFSHATHSIVPAESDTTHIGALESARDLGICSGHLLFADDFHSTHSLTAVEV